MSEVIKEESKPTDLPRSAGSNLPAADSHQLEASQEVPPRKRMAVPGTSRQAELEWDRAKPTGSRQIDDGNNLYLAAALGDATSVKILLARGANTRMQDDEGQTPLHVALLNKNREAANLLVEADGKNDVPCKQGYTPLLRAAAWSRAGDIVHKLVAAGARLHHQNCSGATALHLAIALGKRAGAQLMVDLDRENNIPDEDGNTPLHYAATTGNEGVVETLLSSGVSPHMKNMWDEYPIYIAARHRHAHIVEKIFAVYALRGIEVNEVDLFCPRRSMSLLPHQIQHSMSVYAEFNAEIRRMKETKIGGSNVSYYDIATRHMNSVATCLRNEDLRKELLCGRVALNFLKYADVIAQKVGRAEKKRALVDECLECFRRLFAKLPPLPQTVMNIVIRCLSERDMNNVIKASKF